MDDVSNISDTGRTSEQAAANDGQGERDDKGRFGKGNCGGPGNPFARQSAMLRQAALKAVSDDDIREIIEALKAKAKGGDVAASKLLLSYTVGKPTAAADPDTLNQHEYQTIVNNHVTSMDGTCQVIQGMPIDALLMILRALIPVLFASKLQMVKEVLSAPPEDEDEFNEAEEHIQENAAAGAAARADSGKTAPDNIAPWMHEIDQSNQRSEVRGQKSERTELRAYDTAINELEVQVRHLLQEIQRSREQPAEGRPRQLSDGELLHSLLERTRGLQCPSPNGVNGRSGQESGIRSQGSGISSQGQSCES